MIPEPLLAKIEAYKKSWKFKEALKIVNGVLAKDPSDKEALFQVADIEYRQGEIKRAEKPIDFLLKGADNDAMSHYVKWVLEMEKTQWVKAKEYFKTALSLMHEDNPEIMRCYGLCEYRSGNREDGIEYLRKALEANKLDAEIILNLIEVLILEKEWDEAQKNIDHFEKNKAKLQLFDRDLSYYEDKIRIFADYVESEGKDEEGEEIGKK